ncbi:hypothetical protein X801_07224 [Opisthorchis viverrini]|uniref:Uncharacterized protein n=1 Tax=Opisthorchis viverrini TaxID=6198 RepID=A0A1S8WR39_OPIVI|nr:hypothetical protein X801_07224 [Opisthorchis viverrini]
MVPSSSTKGSSRNDKLRGTFDIRHQRPATESNQVQYSTDFWTEEVLMCPTKIIESLCALKPRKDPLAMWFLTITVVLNKSVVFRHVATVTHVHPTFRDDTVSENLRQPRHLCQVRLSEKNEPLEFKQKVWLPLRSPRIYSSYRSVHQPASLAIHCEQESCFTGYAIGGHNL